MATIRDRYVLEVDTKGAEQGVNKAKGSVAGLAAGLTRLGPLAVAAGGALAGIGAVKGISNTISSMDDLAKAARNVGAANAESFDDFQVITQQLGEMGLSGSETERALRNLTTRMEKAAATGKGPAADAFALLGDRVLDANGNLQSMPDLFETVTGAIQDGSLSVSQAQAIFGEMVGPKILGGFQDLADKGVTVKESLADVRANSNIVSLDSATQAEAFGDTMDRLGTVAGRLGTSIVEKLLPVLLNLAENALAVLPSIIDGVGAAFDALWPIIEAVIPVGQALFDLLQALWPVFETLLGVIGPVVEILAGALTTAIKTVSAVIEAVINTITGFIQSLTNIKDKVVEVKNAVSDNFSSMKDSVVSSAQDAYSGVTGWFNEMYDEVVGNSIVPDMVDGVVREFAAMERGMDDTSKGAVTRVAGNFSALNTIIEQVVGPNTSRALNVVAQQFGGFENIIRGVFDRISGFSLSSVFSGIGNIFSGSGGGILGGITNALSGVGNFVSNLFAGFFANGGMIPSGQFGVVGERGPELISGPATVTPISAGTSTQYVTYNINAVDASSFKGLIARDPAFIHAVAQQGAKKIPRRR